MMFATQPPMNQVPKTTLLSFVPMQTITRNVTINTDQTISPGIIDDASNAIYDGSFISQWGVNGVSTWGNPGLGGITVLRFNGFLFKLTYIGAYNFYGHFIDTFGNMIPTPYTSIASLTSFETGYISRASFEYPPVALTSDTTTLSARPYGNGTYTLTSTSHDAGQGLERFRCFDKSASSYWSAGLNNYNTTTGTWKGSTTGVYIVPGIGTGDWIRINMPQAITLTSYSIQGRQLNNAEGQSPATWIVAGWNGTSWDILDNQSTPKAQWFGTVAAGEVVTRTVSTDTEYSSYLLFSNRVTDSPDTYETLTIAEWRLYGY
jgi:hypothetical protein